MCGIVGYLGTKTAYPILIDGLKRMEYRGYDSGGLAIAEKDGIVLKKKLGKVSFLEEASKKHPWKGTVGIGHMRWATHGAPSEVNAHPHIDCNDEVFVIHNGIIENASELKAKLTKQGHKFRSETDTEVLAHLIEQALTKHPDLEKAVTIALEQVQGAYGLAVMWAKQPETIVAARLGSPLILGVIDDSQSIVASDVTAILPHTREVIYLEDYDLVTLSRGGYTIKNLRSDLVDRQKTRIDWDSDVAEKGHHPHFMKKEIFEQAQTIATSMRGRTIAQTGVAKLGGLESVSKELEKIERLVIVACGTAFHAGLVGKYLLEEYAHVPTEVVYASEFRYRTLIPDKKTAYLAISQSGETADTIGAIREAKRIGSLTLGIVNVVGSTIARETDAGVYNHIGPEIAVASTKAFTSQVTILALLALFLGRSRGLSLTSGTELIEALQQIPDHITTILKNDAAIKKIAKKLSGYKNALYLGRKYNYPVALEGALKIKEIAYLHAEGYAAGEMKHGPIALIEPDFVTVAIIPHDSVYEKMISNLEEVKARRGPIIAIASEGDKRIKELADHTLFIPKTLESLTPLLATIPLQLLAYHASVARGYDVDKPRNLAKSVTVE